jgi:hypothetical protein
LHDRKRLAVSEEWQCPDVATACFAAKVVKQKKAAIGRPAVGFSATFERKQFLLAASAAHRLDVNLVLPAARGTKSNLLTIRGPCRKLIVSVPKSNRTGGATANVVEPKFHLVLAGVGDGAYSVFSVRGKIRGGQVARTA